MAGPEFYLYEAFMWKIRMNKSSKFNNESLWNLGEHKMLKLNGDQIDNPMSKNTISSEIADLNTK